MAQRAFEGVERIVREVEEECRVRGKELGEIVFPDHGHWSFAREGLKCKVDFGALAAMYDLPWFRRLWVVQEAVLAHTSIIVCGDLSIDFEKVLTATCWLEHKTFFLVHEGPDEELLVCLQGFRGAMNMWLFRKDLADYQHWPIPSPLSWLLGKAPFGASSDMKDQIYGMLGLYQTSAKTMELPPGLAPDYTKDDAEVLRDATRAAIMENRSLNLLERLPQSRDHRPAGLPSWVPEWFREHGDDDPRGLMPVFNACGTSEEWSRTELLPTPDPRVLRIKGTLISTIEKVVSHTKDLHEFEVFLAHLDEAETIASSVNIDSLTLGTTLLGGAAFGAAALATPEEAELWPAYHKYLREEKRNLPWPNDLKADSSAEEKALALFASTSRNACWHRCFFSTVDGQIGIGPAKCRPGDRVVVLQGGHFPFVLREVEAVFEMLGYSYTHGIMQGEAVEGRRIAGATVFDLA